MGIRLALGASLPRVTRHLIADGLKPVALGLACGVAAAWWVTRALEANTLFSSQLFQVTPHDPLTYVAVSTMLLASGLLACWLPARRLRTLQLDGVLRSE
jgi:ABC-type lipoprotein release transport system permease subunit